MKKTVLLVLLVASLAFAQSTLTSTMAATPNETGTVDSTPSVPFVRFQTPTQADIYCAGFISKEKLPDAKYVNGGLQSPTSTKFEIGELVYLTGKDYQVGSLYTIVRELRDVNQYEIYPGMRKLLGTVGHPYGAVSRQTQRACLRRAHVRSSRTPAQRRLRHHGRANRRQRREASSNCWPDPALRSQSRIDFARITYSGRTHQGGSAEIGLSF